MSPSDQPKLCAGCGADVTNAERVKDAKGRYLCASCVKKIRSRQQAGAAGGAATAGAGARAGGSSDQGADLREFMAQAKEAAKNQCPSCGAFAKPGAVICLNCGYDARTQSQLQTKFGTARAAKSRSNGDGGGGSAAAILDHGLLAGGVALLWIAVTCALPIWMAINQQDYLYVLMAGLFNGITAFVFWIFWIISYFRRNTTGKSVLVTIVTFIFGVIGNLIALLYHAKEGPNKVVRALAIAVLISFCVIVISNVTGVLGQFIETDDTGGGSIFDLFVSPDE